MRNPWNYPSNRIMRFISNAIIAIVVFILVMGMVGFIEYALRTSDLQATTIAIGLFVLAPLVIWTARLSYGKLQDETLKPEWWMNYWRAVSVEIIGAITLSIVFAFFILPSQDAGVTQISEEHLFDMVRSPINHVALDAFEQIRVRGSISRDKDIFHRANLGRADLTGLHLFDTSLNRANFSDAKLVDTFLWSVDLQSAYLWGANLEKSNWQYVTLTDANLVGANLANVRGFNTSFDGADLKFSNIKDASFPYSDFSGANLAYAQFQNSQLSNANFRDSDLGGANLLGADLSNANLVGVNWVADDTIFWEVSGFATWVDWSDKTPEAMLPDGTRWTPDTEMGRFTDLEHPEFAETLEKIEAMRQELELN